MGRGDYQQLQALYERCRELRERAEREVERSKKAIEHSRLILSVHQAEPRRSNQHDASGE